MKARFISDVVVVEPATSDDDKSCGTEGIDFSDFLTSGTFSDVQIKCENQKFNCHRLLLAAKSPVFKAMLQNNMAEARSGLIEVNDMKPSVLKALLEYIYMNTIKADMYTQDDPTFEVELLAAAEMYKLE